MNARKVKTVKTEIRIANPTEKVYKTVERIAEKERRTIGKQAEYMLLQYIEQNKL